MVLVRQYSGGDSTSMSPVLCNYMILGIKNVHTNYEDTNELAIPKSKQKRNIGVLL